MPRQSTDSENSDKDDNNKGSDHKDHSSTSHLGGSSASAQGDALSDLRKSNKELISLLDTIAKSGSERQGDAIEKLFSNWLVNSRLEEELLIPEVRMRNIENVELSEAEVKRDLIKILISNIHPQQAEKPREAAKLRVVEKLIRGLVELTEKPGTGLYSRIQSFNVDDIKNKISEQKKKMEQRDTSRPMLRELSIEHLSTANQDKERKMANQDRYSHDRYMPGERNQDRQYGRGDQDRNTRYGQYEDDNRSGGYQNNARGYGGRGGSYSQDRSYTDDGANRSSYRSEDQDYGRYGGPSDYGRWDDPENRGRGQTRWSGYPEGRMDDYTHDRDYRGFSGRDQNDLRRSSYDMDDRYGAGRTYGGSGGLGEYGAGASGGSYRSGGYGRAQEDDNERRWGSRDTGNNNRNDDRDHRYRDTDVERGGSRNRGYY